MHIPFEIRLRRTLHDRAQAAMRQACRVPNRVEREDAERDARFATSLVLLLRQLETTMRDTESTAEFISAAQKFAVEAERATEAVNSIEGRIGKVDFTAPPSGSVSGTGGSFGTSAAPAKPAEPEKPKKWVAPWDDPTRWDLTPEEDEEIKRKSKGWGEV